MKLLTLNEQHTLHHRYKLNDLYRQWSPILFMLQRKNGEADALTIWHMAEQQIVRLRDEQSFREQEIQPIYNELLIDCLFLDATERTKKQAQRTATTVMCIVLTMLMNAVEKGHEEEFFGNEPMCRAIMDIFLKDKYFQDLMSLFFERNTGYDGQKVIIAPSDPMVENTLYESMDDIAKEEIEQTVKKILSHTQPLSSLFKDYWRYWEPLWKNILADTQMMLLIKEVSPRKNAWGFNRKMVCNIVGLFRDRAHLTASVEKINNLLCSTNCRSYISYHADFDGSNSVFNREQHDKISELIDRMILSAKKK